MNKIPQFPQTKKLELSDRKEIEIITKQFPPYSDFHFNSIYSWDVYDSTQISKLNDNLIIKQIDCLTGEQFFSLIGTNSIPKTITEISSFLKQSGLLSTLKWVPEETVKYLNGFASSVIEDRDYNDYIYDIPKMYDAIGSEYSNYRRHIGQFVKTYTEINIRQIDLTDNNIKILINKLFLAWTLKKEIENKFCDPLIENKALNRLLSKADEFKSLYSIGIFYKDELMAFSINDIIENEYGCILFWKADTNFKGAYQFLMKENVNLFRSKQKKYFSLESDLGIEALRISKLKYRPALFLKKYTIEITS